MKEDNYSTCHGPLIDECGKCEELKNCLDTQLKWYCRIPFFIIDNCLDKLSGSAVKVFLCLSRRANFEEGSNTFGRCWLTYTQISEATGVAASNMRRYMGELEGLNLRDHKLTVLYNKESKSPKTVHQFTVKWYGQLNELKNLKKP